MIEIKRVDGAPTPATGTWWCAVGTVEQCTEHYIKKFGHEPSAIFYHVRMHWFWPAKE